MQDSDSRAVAADARNATRSDGGVGRRARLAVFALTFSALTGVFGYGLIALPVHSVLSLLGADIAMLLALVALPLCLAVSAFRLGTSATIERFVSRPDSEHEQAMIRIAIVAIILIYLYVLTVLSTAETHLSLAIVVVAGGFIISWLLLLDIWFRPKASFARRVIGNHADLLLLSLLMNISPQVMAPWYLIYLWVTFGNGFRYGVSALVISATISFIGFGLVIAITPFWQEQLPLGIGLLTALVLLPAYVSMLLKRLRVAINEAESANQAKSRFFASMSHELRTPLTAIIGMGDLMRETSLDSEQLDMTRTIRTAAHSLLGQVNEILDFSKIEAGRVDIAHEPFDLYTVMADVDAILRPQAVSKDIRLSTSISPSVPSDLMGDGEHLREILINLVGNAVKFTSDGRVKIAVSMLGEADAKQLLRFEVHDSGIGIAPEHIDSIFESYSQADGTVTRRFGGTGLGLAISRQLVELMGGKIQVESELDIGSCFSLELPFTVSVADDNSGASTDETQSLAFEARQVILFGDTVTELPGIEAALARWGVEAESIMSPEAVVAKVSSDLSRGAPRAVIICDLNSPSTAVAMRRICVEAGDREPIYLHVGDPANDPGAHLPLPLSELRLPVDEAHLFRALRLAGAFSGVNEKQDRESGSLNNRTPAVRDLKVLLVEDNPVNRRVISKIITSAGHRVFVAGDGDSALDALDAQKFDAVLMDVNIPGLSGPETTKHYRFAHMGEDHLPIIGLTADATLETRQLCLDAGMDDVVTKPVEAVVLADVIESYVLQYGKHSDDEPVSDIVEAVVDPLPIQEPAEPVGEQTQRPPLRVVTDSPIDQKALDSLRELGGDSFVESVINDFLTNADTIMEALRRAIELGDLSSLREHAHALRSSAAHVGATRMHVVAKEINDMNQVDLDARGHIKAEALEAEFHVLRMALTEELSAIAKMGAAS
jgi:two-component system sensor histidine kinase RpfC